VRYRTIVADPPWQYPHPGKFAKGTSEFYGSASSVDRYGAMSAEQLRDLEVPSAENAHLYLWTTNAAMVEAHQLSAAWGFRVITILTWCKTHQDDVGRVSMKTGYYFRGATEHVLFCVRGSLPLQTKEGLPTGFPLAPHAPLGQARCVLRSSGAGVTRTST